MKYNNCLILVFSLINIACVREYSVKIKKNLDARLAVIALLSPQVERNFVFVAKTTNYNEKNNFENLLINNASVSIIDSSENRIALLKLKSSGTYYIDAADFKVKAGNTYLIEVSHSQFKTVKGSTTVPLLKAVWDSVMVSKNKDIYASAQIYGSWRGNTALNRYNFAVQVYNVNNISYHAQHSYKKFSNLLFNYNTSQNINLVKGRNLLRSNLFTTDIVMNKYIEQNNMSIYLEDYDKENFTSIIGVFKGVMPIYSNVSNGAGVIGSYQLDSKTTVIEFQDSN